MRYYIEMKIASLSILICKLKLSLIEFCAKVVPFVGAEHQFRLPHCFWLIICSYLTRAELLT